MDTQQQQYPFSPLVDIFAALSAVEFSALAASILEYGLLEPVAVCRDRIIDGRRRYLACIEAGVEPVCVHLEDDADPVAYVIARNVTPRLLDTGARAIADYSLSR